MGRGGWFAFEIFFLSLTCFFVWPLDFYSPDTLSRVTQNGTKSHQFGIWIAWVWILNVPHYFIKLWWGGEVKGKKGEQRDFKMKGRDDDRWMQMFLWSGEEHLMLHEIKLVHLWLDACHSASCFLLQRRWVTLWLTGFLSQRHEGFPAHKMEALATKWGCLQKTYHTGAAFQPQSVLPTLEGGVETPVPKVKGRWREMKWKSAYFPRRQCLRVACGVLGKWAICFWKPCQLRAGSAQRT